MPHDHCDDMRINPVNKGAGFDFKLPAMERNKMSRTLALIAASTLASMSYADVQTVTNITDYNNAVDPSISFFDGFDGSTQNAVSVTTDIGIVGTLTNGTPFDPPDNYYNHPDFDLSEWGFALDRNGGIATRNLVWDLPDGTIGFWGEWISVTGADVSIVNGDGTWYDISEIITGMPGDPPEGVDGFFGMVDNAGIDQVIFRVDPTFASSFEIFWLTEMGINVVPSPSTAALGLAGLTLMCRRRRKTN